MELSDSTKSVYQACHLYGFAPYTIIRNKRNEIIDLKLGVWARVYSFVLVVFFCISVEHASINDPKGGYPIRSKSAVIFIYWLDLNSLLAAYVIHTISTMFSIQNTFHVNRLLNKVDKHLNKLNGNNELHSFRTRRRLTLSVFMLLFVFILFMVVDFITLHQKNLHIISTKNADTINYLYDLTDVRYNLIPLYIMCTSFVPIHAKLTTTIYRIGLRYRKLNDIICTYIAAAERLNCFARDNKGLSDVTSRLFTIHEMLGQLVNRVSSEFGLTILFLLISSSFHVIISVYFLVSELLENDAIIFIMVQTFWPLSHIIRIYSIIEPCHLISFEAKRTIRCVSRLLRLNRGDFILEHFWQKLLIEVNVGFPICGLFYIDRSLLTSIGGAIATYLVILFQFER